MKPRKTQTTTAPLARRRLPLCLGLLLAAGSRCPAVLAAAEPPQAQMTQVQMTQVQVPPVVVTATRVATPPHEVPASIDVVDAAHIRDSRLQVNISESLAGVPGLQARDRQNYAQDVQLSVRGFGARSTFGIRGLRLYVDGIPATMPDGQGQLSNVDLASVERIEVLRGPFSALYGNSSGGVVQVFTEDGRGPARVQAGLAAGSDGIRRTSLKASGGQGDFGYVASTSLFETDGYREHSAARRRLGNLKLGWQPGADTRFTLVANSVALPLALDPLGLTRAQFAADPQAVDPVARSFNTRKTVEQSQLGLTGEHRFGAVGTLNLMVYGGHRHTEQFQAIPVATQAGALHAGGVIALERDYRGADLRWTTSGQWAGQRLSLVAGVSWDQLDEDRSGRQNFIGSTLGVRGALRRDETNRVRSLDHYLQLGLQPLPGLDLHAGLRRSTVRFVSTDRYIVGPNPDDSGAVSYAATLPVLGASYALTERVRVYATAGRGFETPTGNELAYRPDGQTGLNLALQAARSRNAELGLKLRPGVGGELKLALFDVRTRGEIVTQSNAGGRSTFTNAGTTTRRGVEAAWTTLLPGNVELATALTWLDARYASAFVTCAAAPCTTPGLVIPEGNTIPGVARTMAYLGLAWAPSPAWRAGVEARASSRVMVNDSNSDAAAGFAVAAAHVSHRLRLGDDVELTLFGRIDNLFDQRYAGSVIVGEGNGRFFEPAPGRNWLMGVSGVLRF